MAGKNYPVLDGLRGVAILWVMSYHMWSYAGPSVAGQLISALSGVGWVGVDLFFVLSGFLITGILVDSREQPGFLKRFYLRRILRIVPAYYALVTALLLGWLVLHFMGRHPADDDYCSPQKVWVHYLYLSNFSMAFKGQEWSCFDIAWSLAVEEQFYLVLPFLVLAVGTLGVRRSLLAATFTAPILRVLMFLGTDGNLLTAYVLPFCRMDTLAIGGLVALSLRRGGNLLRHSKRYGPVLALIAVTCLSAGTRKDAWFVLVGYSALALTFGALVCVAVQSEDSWFFRPLRAAWLREAGKLSYGLYLWHLPARALVDRFLWPSLLPAGDLLSEALRSVLCFSLSYVIAVFSWRLIETPFLRLKERVAAPAP